MKLEHAKSYQPLFESQGGLHLTIYLNHSQLGNATLEEHLQRVRKQLKDVMTPEHINEFLTPFLNLMRESLWQKKFQGASVGFFLSKRFFLVTKIPLKLSSGFYLAENFHVKPLLKYEQMKRKQVVTAPSAEVKKAEVNVFKIAQMAILGKIKKLFIAEESEFFGKIHPLNGGLHLVGQQKKSFYDDILDDLAQIVLQKGGEVFILQKKLIPYGVSSYAIMKEEK